MLTQEKIQNVIKIAETKIEEVTKIIEEMKALQNERKTPYGRVEEGEGYYFITSSDCVYTSLDSRSGADDDRYNIGNYYLAEAEAEKASKQITLFRLLDRFSRENGWTDEAWEDGEVEKYHIFKGLDSRDIKITIARSCRHQGAVYFVSKEICEQAIEKYKDLLNEVL